MIELIYKERYADMKKEKKISVILQKQLGMLMGCDMAKKSSPVSIRKIFDVEDKKNKPLTVPK